MKLFVATPMFGGSCFGTYAVGLANLVALSLEKDVKLHYAFMQNESLITRSRDSLAYDFLKSDCDSLLFIDADIGFSAKDVFSLIDADKDVIGGLYPKKEFNFNKLSKAAKADVPVSELPRYTGEFVIRTIKNTSVTGSIFEPFEVEAIGTGFMMIKRKVFENLIGKVPVYVSDMYSVNDANREKKMINQFFDTNICPITQNLLSEDYDFCRIVRDAGMSVWAAPWINLTHTGTYTFSGTLTAKVPS
jgi:hypothetical protein